MKSKSIVLIAISLGFGLVAAIGISQVMGRNSGNAEADLNKRPVVLALEDMDVMTELTEEKIVIEQWPAQFVPEGVAGSLDEIKNKVVCSRVAKRFPIYSRDLVDKNEAARLVIPRGFKVVAIKVPADDVINGLLQPGDLVDIIGIFKKSNAESTSQTFLRKVKVFSIDGRTSPDIKRESVTKAATIVGVLLNEKQTEQLVLVQNVADLKLVMRSDDPADGDDQQDQWSDFGTETSLATLFGGQGAGQGGGLVPFLQSFSQAVKTDGNDAAPKGDEWTMKIFTGEGIQTFRFGDDGLPVAQTLSFGSPASASTQSTTTSPGAPVNDGASHDASGGGADDFDALSDQPDESDDY
jgi:Flp pilus assembly protein CpaB